MAKKLTVSHAVVETLIHKSVSDLEQQKKNIFVLENLLLMSFWIGF